jgi:NTP pyrophosphatase (non-canonical NTP hydrolase)
MPVTKLKPGWDPIQDICFNTSRGAGWWNDVNPGTVPTKLCLIHSEISEAMEGYRKDLMDDKLPHRKAIEVELADAVIRIGDLAGYLGLDVGGALDEKMAYNAVREDHKPEVRAAAGGKKF